MKRLLYCAIVLALVAAPAAAQPSDAAGVGGTVIGFDAAHLLYDQTSNPSANGFPAQDFEAAFDGYDCEGADDFDVTFADGWTIDGFNTVSTQSTGGTPTSVDVTFYDDAAGSPGAIAMCTYDNITSFVDTAGSLAITLDPPCILEQGTYWVAFSSQQDFGTSGQLFWSTRTAPTNADSNWRNPLDGFGSGCTDWDTTPNCGVGNSTSDALFQIFGTEGGATVNPLEVPTLDVAGLAFLALMLIGGTVFVLRRRRSEV